MSLPTPRAGLVISYVYLWAEEHRRGAEDGRKARPCVIVVATRMVEGNRIVTVAPITHSPPEVPSDAIELPLSLKAHLGLDEQRSWVLVTETNEFIWPGFDLRPVPGGRRRFEYGMLPPRFFAHLRDSIIQAIHDRRLKRVPRSDA